jgi:hypothetical protein
MTPPLLLRTLLEPSLASGLSMADWDLLLRQARRANLSARLATALHPQLATIPEAPRLHLESALLLAGRQRQTTAWEVECIRGALMAIGVEPILLKGAAYLMSDMPASHGRLFGDVDILVPKAKIEAVESALQAAGWTFSSELSAYDQRYYRQWMHELPPMGHEHRGTSLDVHHTILPPTARIQVNVKALFEDALELPDRPGVKVLAPLTMFLHSAAHLFHEGELDNGLRDLFDLDALLRDLGRRDGFWTGLVPRAQTLGLARPLYYALRYTQRWLGTPIPASVQRELDAVCAPGVLTRALMDACYARALMPRHASCDEAWTFASRTALYIRSHWLRMPLTLLARHLVHKTWARRKHTPEPTQTAQ